MPQSSRSTSSAKSGTKSPPPKANNAAPDAIKLLKADHKLVAELFDEYEDGKDTMSGPQKKKLATQICEELTVHAQVEEELFYPAIAEKTKDDEMEGMLAEALVEHTSLKRLIADIDDAKPGSAQYDALVEVLGEYTEHHVKEEETEMFPKVRDSKIHLQTLGEQMALRKMTLQDEAA
jgi:hemerythrin superfamily protein